MPIEPNFECNFVVAADQEHVVRLNQQRIESQFRVRLDFTTDVYSKHKERWIKVSAAASREVCSKVTDYVRALCSPETESVHQCPLSLYRQFLEGDLRGLLECEYGVIIKTVDDQRCTIRVCGNELNVAMALSAIDEHSPSGLPATTVAAAPATPASSWTDSHYLEGRLPPTDMSSRPAADPDWHGEPNHWGQQRPSPANLPERPPRNVAGFQPHRLEMDGLMTDPNRSDHRISTVAEGDDNADMNILPPSLPKAPIRPANKRSVREGMLDRTGTGGLIRANMLTTEHPDSSSDISNDSDVPKVSPPSALVNEIDNTSELVEAATRAGFDDMEIAMLLSQNDQHPQSGCYRSPAEFIGALERARQQKNDTAAMQPAVRTAVTTLSEAALLLPTDLGAAAAAATARTSSATGPSVGLPYATAPLARPIERNSSSGNFRDSADDNGKTTSADMVSVELNGRGGVITRRPGEGSLQLGMTPVPSPSSSGGRAGGTFPPMRSSNATSAAVYLAAGADDADRQGRSSRTQPLLGLGAQGLLGAKPQSLLGPAPRPYLLQGFVAAGATPSSRMGQNLQGFSDVARGPASAGTGPLGSKRAGSAASVMSPATAVPEPKSNPDVLSFADTAKSSTDVASFAKMMGFSDMEIEAIRRKLGDNAKHADFMSALKAARTSKGTAEQGMAPAAAFGKSSRSYEQQQQKPDAAPWPELPGSSSRKPGGTSNIPSLLDYRPVVRPDLLAPGHWQGNSQPDSAAYGDRLVRSGPDGGPLQQQKPRGSTPVALVPPTTASRAKGPESTAPHPATGAVRQGRSDSASTSSPSKNSLDIYDFAKTMGLSDEDIKAVIAELGEDTPRHQLLAALKRKQANDSVKQGNQPATGMPSAASSVDSGSQRQNVAERFSSAPANALSTSRANERRGSRRHIVIDGSNVAMYQGDGLFRCRNIQICVNFFLKRGHQDISVVVPMYRKTDPATRDVHILDELHGKKMLVYQPSKKLPNMPSIRPYDDKLILDIASNYDGVVISNDRYIDLMGELSSRDNIIKNRVIMFTIVGDDMFYINDDPMGRHGPSLDDLLTHS